MKREIQDTFHEIFGHDPKLPKKIVHIVENYLPNYEMSWISFYVTKRNLPEYINLTDPEILKKYLITSGEEEASLLKAVEVAKRSYEISPRPILDSKGDYGWSFSLNPEILACLMRLAKDEVVVEFAGAGGENSALLAFAGAKRVYMNDITSGEIRAFRQLSATMPEGVRERLEPVEASCFDLLRLNPALKGEVGLLVCRNLIHFFSDAEQAAFFAEVRTLLRPGGRISLSANANYAFPEQRDLFEQNPDATSFLRTRCFVYDFPKSGKMVDASALIYDKLAISSGVKSASNSQSMRLYEKKAGHRWHCNEEAFAQLDPTIQTDIELAYKHAQTTILGAIRRGRITFRETSMRSYNKKNFADLVARHGFEVEFVSGIDRKGHIVDDANVAGCGTVSVIARYPG